MEPIQQSVEELQQIEFQSIQHSQWVQIDSPLLKDQGLAKEAVMPQTIQLTKMIDSYKFAQLIEQINNIKTKAASFTFQATTTQQESKQNQQPQPIYKIVKPAFLTEYEQQNLPQESSCTHPTKTYRIRHCEYYGKITDNLKWSSLINNQFSGQSYKMHNREGRVTVYWQLFLKGEKILIDYTTESNLSAKVDFQWIQDQIFSLKSCLLASLNANNLFELFRWKGRIHGTFETGQYRKTNQPISRLAFVQLISFSEGTVRKIKLVDWLKFLSVSSFTDSRCLNKFEHYRFECKCEKPWSFIVAPQPVQVILHSELQLEYELKDLILKIQQGKRFWGQYSTHRIISIDGLVLIYVYGWEIGFYDFVWDVSLQKQKQPPGKIIENYLKFSQISVDMLTHTTVYYEKLLSHYLESLKIKRLNSQISMAEEIYYSFRNSSLISGKNALFSSCGLQISKFKAEKHSHLLVQTSSDYFSPQNMHLSMSILKLIKYSCIQNYKLEQIFYSTSECKTKFPESLLFNIMRLKNVELDQDFQSKRIIIYWVLGPPGTQKTTLYNNIRSQLQILGAYGAYLSLTEIQSKIPASKAVSDEATSSEQPTEPLNISVSEPFSDYPLKDSQETAMNQGLKRFLKVPQLPYQQLQKIFNGNAEEPCKSERINFILLDYPFSQANLNSLKKLIIPSNHSQKSIQLYLIVPKSSQDWVFFEQILQKQSSYLFPMETIISAFLEQQNILRNGIKLQSNLKNKEVVKQDKKYSRITDYKIHPLELLKLHLHYTATIYQKQFALCKRNWEDKNTKLLEYEDKVSINWSGSDSQVQDQNFDSQTNFLKEQIQDNLKVLLQLSYKQLYDDEALLCYFLESIENLECQRETGHIAEQILRKTFQILPSNCYPNS